MKKRVLLSVLVSLFCFGILFFLNVLPGIQLELQFLYEREDECQIFWGNDIGTLNEIDSAKYPIQSNQSQKINQRWESQNNILRLDFGTTMQKIKLEELSIGSKLADIRIPLSEIGLLNDLAIEELENGEFALTVTGEDPYFVAEISESIKNADVEAQGKMRIVYAVVALVAGFFVFWQYRRMCILILWIYNIWENRGLILELAVTDFKTRYAASYLGAVWAFVQPVVTVAIYVLVFGYGFKSTPVDGYPFVPWLVAGIVPWFYFQDSITMATNSLSEYSYLVKKVVFEVKILPIVKIVAALLIHLVFLILAVFIHMGYGFFPDIYYLQLIYYCFCTTILALGIAYLTTALNVFFPDLQQIVNIILQFGIWLTPIMWNSHMFGEGAIKFLQINPMYYVVSGYRDCFYEKTVFWEKPGLTIYFWVLTVCLFVVGTYVFQKLEKHFADVL